MWQKQKCKRLLIEEALDGSRRLRERFDPGKALSAIKIFRGISSIQSKRNSKPTPSRCSRSLSLRSLSPHFLINRKPVPRQLFNFTFELKSKTE